MIKTFSFGILLGVVLTAAFLYLVPVVDQHREASIISVQANGGNTEAFHVNLPEDRILHGAPGSDLPVPASLEWPEGPRMSGSQSEIFKVRNRDDVVIGVASRMSGPVSGGGRAVEWTVHLPARGSVYVSLSPTADPDGTRAGRMLAGTREFAGMRGNVREKIIVPMQSSDMAEGRIELVTALVGKGDSL